MKKKTALILTFVFAVAATILFLVDVVMDSSRLVLAGIGVVLTAVWIAYALILRKVTDEGKNALESLAHKYEGKLSQTEWTEVYLKPSAIHKQSIYNAGTEGEKVRFYAKIQPNTDTSIWSDRLPYILVAVVKDEEWITDSTTAKKYGVKGFEEFFSLEK